jgi:hypothetical protein
MKDKKRDAQTRRDALMNENVNQPEQDLTQVGTPFPGRDGPLSQQDPALSADSPYEETPLPYLPLQLAKL